MSGSNSIAVLLVILTVVGSAGWMLFGRTEGTQVAPQGAVQFHPAAENVTKEGETARPEGWREYRNAAYGFSLFHPEALMIREQPEGGGASTITFEDIPGGKGFQIFILPYAEKVITKERVSLDLPSGVVKDQVPAVIDGTQGTEFYSYDAMLGETREVWFIRGGYLYEVTAPKELDAWLLSILPYWTFL